MGIKLLAIDIDGTLVNDQLAITPKTIAALKNASAQGAKVVITTGRPLCGFQNYLDQLGVNHQDDQYVICYNGSLIQTTNGQVLRKESFDFNDYLDLELFARKHGVRICLSTPDCMYTANEDLSPVMIHESWKVHIPLKFRTMDELERLKSQLVVVKGMMLDSPTILDRIERELPEDFKDRFTILRSEVDYLEFISKQASKELALAHLTAALKLKPAEVMSFGNGLNDIGMIKYAGVGVAMGNSEQGLLDAADYITADNNHDGIAQAIEKFM